MTWNLQLKLNALGAKAEFKRYVSLQRSDFSDLDSGIAGGSESDDVFVLQALGDSHGTLVIA